MVASVQRECWRADRIVADFLGVDCGLACRLSADGARKSRYGSCEVAAVRYALAETVAGLTMACVATLLTARRHEVHMVDEEAMLCCLCVGCED